MHRKRNIFEYLDQCKTPDLEFQLVEYHEHHHEITGLPSYDDDLQKHDISAYTGFKTDAHQDEGDRQGMSVFVLPLPSPPPVVTASPQATLDLRKFLGMKKTTPFPRKKRVVKRKLDVKIPTLDTFFS